MKGIFASIAAVITLSLLAGCGNMAESSTTIFAMDTVMTLTAYGDNGEAAVSTATVRINELDTLLSTNRESSQVWAINHSNGTPTALSSDTGLILQQAQALGGATGGALDITIYPVVKAWGFTTGDYTVPAADQLAALLDKVNYAAVSYDPAANTVSLPSDMELDLGAVAKGYTGDAVAAVFAECGVTSGVANLGGNIRTIGTKPNGDLWSIGIQDPEDESAYFGVLSVADCSVVTSGSYERYFQQDGQTYWHILNPATGYPADSGLISVTIVGENGTLCDGLSTALFVMGLDGATAYWRENGGFDMVLMTKERDVWITAGLFDSAFHLSDGYDDLTVQEISQT